MTAAVADSVTYAGPYNGAYAGPYNAGPYNAGPYIAPVVTTSYVGPYTGAYAGPYTGAYAGPYNGAYAGPYNAVYQGPYSAGTYPGPYNGAFAGPYTAGNYPNNVNYGPFYGSQTLQYVGDCASHACGVCQGDCDSDSDCAGGLKCMQRNGNQPVPGCVGSGFVGEDFCYDPNHANGYYYGTQPGYNGQGMMYGQELRFTNQCDDGECGICEGDCDSDSDCANGLICYTRSGNEIVPGCIGNGYYGTDFCAMPYAYGWGY
jgi:hypothetical protein